MQPSAPISITVANKTFGAWQLHPWSSPDKNATFGALGRGVGSIANSSKPLNATKSVVKGIELYSYETSELFKSKSGLVTIAPSVRNPSLPTADLQCFVSPTTGQLVGLQQGGTSACSTTSTSVVTVPTSTNYISQIKLAYTYDGLFVGRLIFELRANATAKAVEYSCGTAGGKAVGLLPWSDLYLNANKKAGLKGLFAVSHVAVGCAPSALSSSGFATVPSATGFKITAVPLAALPVDPATGLPETPGVGNVLAVGTASGPTVTLSTTDLSILATTLVITGTGFDASSPSGNTVVFSNGAIGVVTAATLTSLTVTLSTRPTSTGPLTAVVTSLSQSSGEPVQVATVVLPASGLPNGVYWQSITSSTDGTKLLAADASPGNLWLSTDSGWTWTAQAGGAPVSANWGSVTSSDDGQKLFAAVQGGDIWLSSDAGATWVAQTGGAPTPSLWRPISCSADGNKVVAAIIGGTLYLSSDAGVSWTAQTGGAPSSTAWNSIASSANGDKVAATVTLGDIWLSADSGVTWVAQSGGGAPVGAAWQGIASSADGTKLAAVATQSGNIWLSSDSGVNWVAQNGGAPTSIDWASIAMSADGSRLVAGTFSGGPLWRSSNSGATWSSVYVGAPSVGGWYSITMSADGVKVAAVDDGGTIWVSFDSGATWFPRY